MQNTLSEKERDRVTALAKEAGAKLLSFWRDGDNHGDHLEITEKSDGTNVTNADIASNDIIVSGLKKFFPSDRILSEEIAPESDIDSAERVWIVDPLDGTQSFIEGRNDFSVLIALTVNKIVVFGICYFPARDQFYLTGPGPTTLQNGTPTVCSVVDTPGVERIYVRGCEIADPAKKYPHHVDSCLGFAMIARGELDGAIIRIKRLKQWDLAAPAALIIGAGGRVSDEFGGDILYSAHSFNYRYFVVSNGKCHEALLRQIIE